MGFFFGYLHNSVFPPLLSEAEEAANLQALAAGSEEAKQILIDAYLDDVISQIENENVKTWIKSFL